MRRSKKTLPMEDSKEEGKSLSKKGTLPPKTKLKPQEFEDQLIDKIEIQDEEEKRGKVQKVRENEGNQHYTFSSQQADPLNSVKGSDQSSPNAQTKKRQQDQKDKEGKVIKKNMQSVIVQGNPETKQSLEEMDEPNHMNIKDKKASRDDSIQELRNMQLKIQQQMMQMQDMFMEKFQSLQDERQRQSVKSHGTYSNVQYDKQVQVQLPLENQATPSKILGPKSNDMPYYIKVSHENENKQLFDQSLNDRVSLMKNHGKVGGHGRQDSDYTAMKYQQSLPQLQMKPQRFSMGPPQLMNKLSVSDQQQQLRELNGQIQNIQSQINSIPSNVRLSRPSQSRESVQREGYVPTKKTKLKNLVGGYASMTRSPQESRQTFDFIGENNRNLTASEVKPSPPYGYYEPQLLSSNGSPREESYRKVQQNGTEQILAEQINKVCFREFQNNTRLNIKNVNYAANKDKRDKAISYWKNRVVNGFLPPIDYRKRDEINQRIIKLKKQIAPHKQYLYSLQQERLITKIRSNSFEQKEL